MARITAKTVAIIVAHPDDETLWTGGTILGHPSWKCLILCLCRKSDNNRATKFYKAVQSLKSEGIMGDLDDGPEQNPLDETELAGVLLDLLPHRHFDLIITHNPNGEYTRHIRHEETGRAVIKLWHTGKIVANELWIFAYEDGKRKYYPRPIETAAIYNTLTNRIWMRKYSIITEIYGFEENSWEAETTPRAEAFMQFSYSYSAKSWLHESDNKKRNK